MIFSFLSPLFGKLWPSFCQRGRLRLPAYGLLALLAFCVFLPGQNSLPPFDRDESRFMQASKQMLETGDFIDIRYQDHARHQKPVGIYWLQISAISIFGDGNTAEIWVNRLPSFLAAILAVLLTGFIGARLFSPQIGFVAAILFLSCIVFNAEARLAKTDAALLACILLAQSILASLWARVYRHEKAPKFKYWPFFLFWLALVVGTLIKGPLIWMVCGTTILAWHFTQNSEDRKKATHWLSIGLRPWMGIPLFLLLVSPWFMAIMLQSSGAFAEASAGRDLLSKIWEGQNWGIGPPGLHALLMPVIAWPASFAVLLALPIIWENRKNPVWRFCLCWLLPSWLVFELSLTKLAHYTLPLYPALMILASAALLEKTPRRAPILSAIFLCLSFIVIMAITLLPMLLKSNISPLAMAGAVAAFLSMLLACWAVHQQNQSRVVFFIFLSAIPFIPIQLGHALPRIDTLWPSQQMANAIKKHAHCAPTKIYTTNYSEPSLVYLTSTETKLNADPIEAARLAQQQACSFLLIGSESENLFLAALNPNLPMPEKLESLKGFNYNKGDWVITHLYASKP